MMLVINNYFFLTKKSSKRVYIYKMIVVENGATRELFKVSICNFFRSQKYFKKCIQKLQKKFTLRL